MKCIPKRKFNKIIAIILLLASTFSMFSMVFATTGEENAANNNLSKGISPISGTFIQPWMYSAWSDERWNDELKMLKELGIEYIVMGDVAEKTDDGKWYTFYNSSLPEVEKMHYEGLDKLFEKCDEFGIKLYLGMGVDHKWWGWDLSKDDDQQSFYEAAEMSVKFANELYKKYKKKYPKTYYGFYSVYELWNHDSWNEDASRESFSNALSKGFNIILDGINKIDSSMPFLFSPFSSPTENLASLENTQKFYTDFFKKTNFREFDAFSPMDNIGGGGQTLDTVENWMKAYSNAIKDSGNKLKFWSNCESFVQPDDSRLKSKNGIDYWSACTVDRFVKQVDIAKKYCERIFNFAYPHYFSPYNNIAGYHEVYTSYLKTGKKDDIKPIPPNKIQVSKVKLEEKDAYKISWSGVWDDFGISRVNVYKNGSLLDYRSSTRNDGRKDIPAIPNFIYDEKLVALATFTNYEFEVIDCWGNVSERSKFTVMNDDIDKEIPLNENYESCYKEGKFFVSNRPVDPFPTEFKAISDEKESNEISSTSPNELMGKIYLISIIIVSILLIIGIVSIIIYRKKTKK